MYYFFFQQGYPHFKKTNDKIADIERALFKINKILESRPVVEKEYDVIEQKFSNQQITKNVSTNILQNIKSNAAEAGLNVVNIKPMAAKEEGLYSEFDFKLETEGELKNFGRFLYNLVDSTYIYKVKYNQISAHSTTGSLKIQLLLSAALAKE